jgi:hypothetical protein
MSKHNDKAEQLANDVVKALDAETERLRALVTAYIKKDLVRAIVTGLTCGRNHLIIEQGLPKEITLDLLAAQLKLLDFEVVQCTAPSDGHQQIVVYDLAAWVAFHRTPVK